MLHATQPRSRQNIVGFLESIFDCLVASMEELTAMHIDIEDRFTNSSPVRVLPAQDVVLSVHFQAGSELLLGDLRLGKN